MNKVVEERTRRTEWYREARFGMFIHWGLYAIPASRNSRTRSRPQGALVDLKSVSFESNRQKPSWCLAVSTAYFMPASFAILAHSLGS